MITAEHEAFARAVVAMAREHGMNHLQLRFQLSHGFRHAAARDGLTREHYEQVEMAWSEGRHGVASSISLKTTGSATISERADGAA